MYFNPPKFSIFAQEKEEEDNGEEYPVEDTQPMLKIENKYDISVKCVPNAKYKCFNLAENLKEQGYEDIYVNETQGICHFFTYAENSKKAKYRVWKMMRSLELIDYFEGIEVKEVETRRS